MIALGLAARWVHLAAGCFLVGAFALALLAGRRGGPTMRAWDARLAGWTRGAAAALLGSGLALLAYQAAVATGSPAAAWDPAAWLRLLATTRFGTVWLVRHGLLLLVAALLLLREREHGPPDWIAFRVEVWLLSALAAGALAWGGHAAAGEPDAGWAALIDALHLVAAGAWLGALWPLGALCRAAAAEAGADARPFAVLAARRFSVLALAAMLVIVGTGAVNAWHQVGGVPALLGTRYGWLLLVKLGLLLPVLGLAALNRRRLLPALPGDGPTVGRPAMARLGRFVAWEGALALAILLVTSGLGLTPPARHESPWWPLGWRLAWELAEEPAVRTRLLIGSQVAFLGLLTVVVAVMVGRRRGLLAAAGAAAAAGGLWVALPPLAVDAYPTTYRQSLVPYQAASISSGLALYAAHCATCHGPEGRGDGPGGARLPRRPADLTGPHTRQHTVGDLFWWLTHGIPAGGMPGFGTRLSEEERWDLVNLVRTLGADARAAGRLGPLVEPNRPWLAAPDFTFAEGPAPRRSLKDFRERWMVLLVLFSLPDSSPRLAQLARAYSDIQVAGCEIVAVPADADPEILRRLGAAPRIFYHVVTDGAAEIVPAWALLAGPPGPGGPFPRHAEFLVDREGYLRARWRPGAAGKGWDDLQVLLKEIRILDQEEPAGPPPGEHVH